jgi:hypothetical protein
MNKNLKLHAKTVMALGLCGTLLLNTPVFAEGKPAKFRLAAMKEEDPAGKKAKAKAKSGKNFTSLNNQSVKIYPDAFNREMHVIAKDNDGKTVDFFVFDLEGTLIQNYKMKSKDHNKITGLKRGIYIYRVFSGDEETASGKFEIR